MAYSLSAYVSQRIKQAREEANLTQAELAEKLGFSDKITIYRYEKNTRQVTLDVLEAIANITGKSPHWFICGKADYQLLSADTYETINAYESLSPYGKKLIRDYLQMALGNINYRSDHPASMDLDIDGSCGSCGSCGP